MKVQHKIPEIQRDQQLNLCIQYQLLTGNKLFDVNRVMCAINLWMNQSTLLNQALLQSIHIAVNIISSGEDKQTQELVAGACIVICHKKRMRKHSRKSINI